ncbi:glycosyltransferase family 2 protein [Rhizobium leguminosarum]|uniref:glycosyltransferase family 2 protein n=1 Tax=Rhizobium leguminosarum TaxID=384 RepID=UPI001C944CF8|nr:glycosyltransferase family 2 protein [Rhizobium leguminosarum]MBY5559244.1 glycosyltransferase [Rhizobium leguminosarum]MBY5708377.1 glycosyltransferase [Rhizobium leguminosarum]MBY5757848.1 glycosyltransferase [Rhizobium leguminosarum]
MTITAPIGSTRPRITLITVCWNAEKTIASTLDSVDAQTFRDFEHLIIDGGSTDATLSIVATAGNRTVFSGPDKGIYDAMNKGIARASGDIVGFLNADDMFANDSALETIATALENEEFDCCYGDLIYVSQQDPTRQVRYWKSSTFAIGAFRRGWCPPHPTFYVRRSIYKKYGSFDQRYSLAADVELMMRFLERARITSLYIPKVLVTMRLGGATNKSFSNIRRQNTEILQALATHGLKVSALGFWAPKLLNRLQQFVRKKQEN